MKEKLSIASEIKLLYTPKIAASERPKICSSADANFILRQFFDPSQLAIREEAVAIYLNRGNRVIGAYKISSGGVTSTIIDPRLVLSTALKCLACGIIIAHSHPSGELNPSRTDVELTEKIREGAKLLDISLLDHLILTTERYLSFADEGLL